MGRKRATIGDILEVKTPRGLAYLQYTHEQSSLGPLVRILPGLYESRPKDLNAIANQKELYFTFYILAHALRSGGVEIVCNQAIPDWARPYPMMRASRGHDETGKTDSWIIIPADMPFTLGNLEKASEYTSLTPDQMKLSIHEIWSHPSLVKRLAQEWIPERAEEFRMKAAKEMAAEQRPLRADGSVSPRPVQHYLYFLRRQPADEAAQWFCAQGYSAEVRPSADGESWLTLVKHQRIESEYETTKLRDEIEAVASQLGGEYDGWEVPNG